MPGFYPETRFPNKIWHYRQHLLLESINCQWLWKMAKALSIWFFTKTTTQKTKNGEITIFFSTKIQISIRPLLTWFGLAWGRNNSGKPVQKEPLTVLIFLPYFMKPTSEKGLKVRNVPQSPKKFLNKKMMSTNLLLIPASFVRKKCLVSCPFIGFKIL